MAMSEQCTAPHMLRQQARAIRSFPGIGFVPSKYSCRSSMTHFTTPDASVAAEWQWTHPWVWTMLEMAAPIPPTG